MSIAKSLKKHQIFFILWNNICLEKKLKNFIIKIWELNLIGIEPFEGGVEVEIDESEVVEYAEDIFWISSGKITK